MEHKYPWPKLFYGDKRDVKARLAKAVSQAFKAKSWAAVDAMNDCQVDDGVEDLMVGSCTHMISPGEERWRFYLLSEALFNAHFDKTRNDKKTYYSLVLAGLENLWGALGLFEGDVGDIGILQRFEHGDEWDCDLLSKFLNWVPEFQELQPRMIDFTAYGNRFIRKEDDVDEIVVDGKVYDLTLSRCRRKTPRWAHVLFRHAARSGWNSGGDSDRVFRTHRGDAIRILLDDNVIEPSGDGRYRPTQQFIDQARRADQKK